jgi:Cu+-exporting ATPase
MTGRDASGNIWKFGTANMSANASDKNFDLNLFKDDIWVAGITLADALRADAGQTMDILHGMQFKTVLLSGDRKSKVETLSQAIGIDIYFAEQSPSQKMDHLESLLKTASTAMVGDGINDAPALAKADIGISLSDATKVAIQSANVILSNNKLSSLPKAIKLGRFTYQTIKQNLFWAFFYNVLAIPLAAMGYLSPIWAALVMAFSDVILVLNSLRLNFRKID